MKSTFKRRTFVLSLTLMIFSGLAISQSTFVWGKQFGTDRDEYVLNHLNDSDGNIYVAGKTGGVMDGKNYGLNDGFLIKIDSSGNSVWTKQFGSDGDEDIQWSCIDKKGYVYITGSTTGLLGSRKYSKEDIFIVKYDPQGNMVWAKQFGTDSTDIAKGIYPGNDGEIYITGMTNGKLGQNVSGKGDCFIMKLDATGNEEYVTQFGTPEDDFSYSITGGSADRIFVCGSTWGDLAGKNRGMIDGFTGEFTTNGKLVKYNQFGTDGFDIAMILCVDDDTNIYVGGSTSGNFGGPQLGEGDCFLLQLTPDDKILWNNQFGTKSHDGVRSIDFDKTTHDNILISGIMNLPPAMAFIRMYKKDGPLIWERKFTAVGKITGTSGKDVSIDSKGNIYHAGLTGANMFGTLIGENDVYLVKLGTDK